MKNKNYSFMSTSTDGTVHNYGISNNKLLVSVWYKLNKKSIDKKFYVVDELGVSYPTCPVGVCGQRALRDYLKTNSHLIESILKKGDTEKCEKNL